MVIEDSRPAGGRLRRKWLMDWAGSLTVMAGATVAGFAFIFVHDIWLWVAAAVLIVCGAAVWIVAGPGAASRSVRSDRHSDADGQPAVRGR